MASNDLVNKGSNLFAMSCGVLHLLLALIEGGTVSLLTRERGFP